MNQVEKLLNFIHDDKLTGQEKLNQITEEINNNPSLLFSGLKFKRKNYNREDNVTLLRYLANENQFELLEELVTSKQNLFTDSEKARKILSFVLIDIVQYAKIILQNNDKDLQNACINTIKFLFEFQNINLASSYKDAKTHILHYFADIQHEDYLTLAAQVMKKHPALVTQPDNYQRTPIYYALNSNNSHFIALALELNDSTINKTITTSIIIKKNADILFNKFTYINQENFTLVDYLLNEEYFGIVFRLFEVFPNKFNTHSNKHNFIEYVLEYITGGTITKKIINLCGVYPTILSLSLNYINDKKMTLLEYYIHQKEYDVVKILLMDFKAKISFDETLSLIMPQIQAGASLSQSCLEVIEFILANVSDSNTRLTAIDYLIKTKINDNNKANIHTIINVFVNKYPNLLAEKNHNHINYFKVALCEKNFDFITLALKAYDEETLPQLIENLLKLENQVIDIMYQHDNNEFSTAILDYFLQQNNLKSIAIILKKFPNNCCLTSEKTEILVDMLLEDFHSNDSQIIISSLFNSDMRSPFAQNTARLINNKLFKNKKEDIIKNIYQDTIINNLSANNIALWIFSNYKLGESISEEHRKILNYFLTNKNFVITEDTFKKALTYDCLEYAQQYLDDNPEKLSDINLFVLVNNKLVPSIIKYDLLSKFVIKIYNNKNLFFFSTYRLEIFLEDRKLLLSDTDRILLATACLAHVNTGKMKFPPGDIRYLFTLIMSDLQLIKNKFLNTDESLICFVQQTLLQFTDYSICSKVYNTPIKVKQSFINTWNTIFINNNSTTMINSFTSTEQEIINQVKTALDNPNNNNLDIDDFIKQLDGDKVGEDALAELAQLFSSKKEHRSYLTALLTKFGPQLAEHQKIISILKQLSKDEQHVYYIELIKAITQFDETNAPESIEQAKDKDDKEKQLLALKTKQYQLQKSTFLLKMIRHATTGTIKYHFQQEENPDLQLEFIIDAKLINLEKIDNKNTIIKQFLTSNNLGCKTGIVDLVLSLEENNDLIYSSDLFNALIQPITVESYVYYPKDLITRWLTKAISINENDLPIFLEKIINNSLKFEIILDLLNDPNSGLWQNQASLYEKQGIRQQLVDMLFKILDVASYYNNASEFFTSMQTLFDSPKPKDKNNLYDFFKVKSPETRTQETYKKRLASIAEHKYIVGMKFVVNKNLQDKTNNVNFRW